jgi:myosin heavy subunit
MNKGIKTTFEHQMTFYSCEWCKKTFSNKGNLTTHTNTAKYCISLRGAPIISVRSCTYCQKSFSVRCVDNHMKTCSLKKDSENDSLKTEVESLKSKKDEIVLSLESQVASLHSKIIELESKVREVEAVNKVLVGSQKCVEEIAKQPKTTNTNNKTTNKVSILTPLDLSQERLKELVEANFTSSHLLEGQKGVARFTVEHVIKDEDGKLQYICTDPARHTFRFKEGDTEIKDIRGKLLSVALAPPVMDKTSRLGIQAIKENPELFCVYSDSQQSIRDMRDDDAEFRGELASMTG